MSKYNGSTTQPPSPQTVERITRRKRIELDARRGGMTATEELEVLRLRSEKTHQLPEEQLSAD